MTFSIYDVDTLGIALWTETQAIHVTAGVVDALLGSRTALDLPFDEPYWLGVSVDGGAELYPRTPLAATPYSFRAAVADSVSGALSDADWVIDGGDIYRMTGNVGIGTADPICRLHVDVPGSDHSNYAFFRTSGGTGYAGGILLSNSESPSGTSFKMTSSYNFTDNGYARFGFVDNDDTETFIAGPTLIFGYGGDLFVEEPLSLKEVSAPSATSGYGRLYVKSSDSKLYFKSDGGTEYDLTGGGGGGTVTSISDGTGITCSPDPITTSGTVSFDQSYGDSRYVNESQSNSISSGMIQSSAVTSAKINNDAVTADKLAHNINATGIGFNADEVDGYDAGNSSGQVAVSNGTLCSNLNADKIDGSHVIVKDIFTGGSNDYFVNTSWVKVYGYGTSYRLKIENPSGSGTSIRYVYSLDFGTPTMSTLSEGSSTTFSYSGLSSIEIRIMRHGVTADYQVTLHGINCYNGWVHAHVIYN